MYADIIDIQSISTMARNKMVSVCGYISNNITNKHYWPKTGRSSQKQSMYQSNLENQINPKTNYKISYQMISMKHLEQIMFNQISNLISIPIEKNFMLKQHNK